MNDRDTRFEWARKKFNKPVYDKKNFGWCFCVSASLGPAPHPTTIFRFVSTEYVSGKLFFSSFRIR